MNDMEMMYADNIIISIRHDWIEKPSKIHKDGLKIYFMRENGSIISSVKCRSTSQVEYLYSRSIKKLHLVVILNQGS